MNKLMLTIRLGVLGIPTIELIISNKKKKTIGIYINRLFMVAGFIGYITNLQ